MLPVSLLLAIALSVTGVAPSTAAFRVRTTAYRALSATQPWPVHPVRAPRRSPVHRINALSFRGENDVVAGTDENYTNGVSMTWAREGRGPLGGVWARVGARGDRMVSSYELAQVIITPADIKRRVPDPTDRPYAGLLLAAVSTQLVEGNRFDALKLIAGVVGPASLAAQTQRAIHRAIASPEPQGWAYQLKNEPVLNAVYEHRRRYTLLDSAGGWGADAIPMAGGMLGNLLIQSEAEAQFRIGYNVPDDFGTTLLRGMGNLPYPRSRHDREHHRFGIYVFAGGGASAVARNLTLDGNTFRSGPRVAKKPLFPGAEAGLAVWTQRYQVTLTYIVWGREYDTQPDLSRYGALTMGVHF